MPYEAFDRSKMNVLPLAKRKNIFTLERLYNLTDPIPEYDDPLLDDVADRVAHAVLNGKQVIWMQGAHILKQGNSRFLVDMIEKGIIQHLATNGAAAIHDFEFSLIGASCESVEENIQDGTFGNWLETGKYMQEAVIRGWKDGIGYGESIGRAIQNDEEEVRCPHKDISIFAAAYRCGIPATVHKGIGYDIIEQHPATDYAAVGGTSGLDFLIMAQSISKLSGGVLLNFGSQVMGPEVFLKGLSMARNVAQQSGDDVRGFSIANFDLKRYDDSHKVGSTADTHYYDRVKKTLLNRTVKDGGESFHIAGDFRVTVPNFYKRVMEKTGRA